METRDFNSSNENELQNREQQANASAEASTPNETVNTPIPPLPRANQPSFFNRIKLPLKVLIIGFLTLLLLIPMSMIKGLITEREQTANDAADEVHQKWSGAQTIAGPILSIPFYRTEKNEKGKVVQQRHYVQILPEKLEIDGQVKTEELKRGLYEIVVYNAPIELKGVFVLPADTKFDEQMLKNIQRDGTSVNLGISDLRGISEQVEMKWNDATMQLNPGVDATVQLNPGIDGEAQLTSGVSCKVDITPLLDKKSIAFSIKLHLKGSDSLLFAPLGKTTTVNLTSNCATPSFTGAFLPTKRSVESNGFKCDWKIMNLNRNYPQVMDDTNSWRNEISASTFGVNMLLPVQHYQKSMRSVKYAMLIILLTFVVSFFVEILQKKQIHPLQYLLIGLALCLFYTLLISISEHINFNIAYAIASGMTVGLITLYMAGVLKIKKTAVLMGALLSCLYIYVFVLIQMETYALLAGSVGLFVILAIIMYVSQRINWSGQISREN